MDIQNSGTDTFMAHECLDGHKISTIFIKMGPESVPESMAGDPFGPAKLYFVIMDMPGDKESIDRAGRVSLFGKEQTGRPAACKPVRLKDLQGMVGQDGIPVGPVLSVSDMDPFIPALDIFIPEVTDFPNAQTGRIHEGGHSFDFDVRDGLNKGPGFFLRRHIREISVELPHGELGWIPGLMENIHREEADLRDSTVDGAVR